MEIHTNHTPQIATKFYQLRLKTDVPETLIIVHPEQMENLWLGYF
jgi:hypothetical protein